MVTLLLAQLSVSSVFDIVIVHKDGRGSQVLGSMSSHFREMHSACLYMYVYVTTWK